MNKWLFFYLPLIAFAQAEVNPYASLHELQGNVVNQVCEKFDVSTSGTASSCYTAIRNLYWSFVSNNPLSQKKARILLYDIYEYIYSRINLEKGIEIIKMQPILDADFLHVVLFFPEKDRLSDASIDLMRGWTTLERYNAASNSLIFKERRLLVDVMEKADHPALMPEEAKFFTQPDFSTHLTLRQPFGELFSSLGGDLKREMNDIGIIQFRFEDRACNACESSFGKVRKLFFLGKWTCIDPFPKENGRGMFLKAMEKILSCVNSNRNIRPYLATYPLKMHNIELVLIPNCNHSRESSWLQSIFNIGNNILFMEYRKEKHENLLRDWEKYCEEF